MLPWTVEKEFFRNNIMTTFHLSRLCLKTEEDENFGDESGGEYRFRMTSGECWIRSMLDVRAFGIRTSEIGLEPWILSDVLAISIEDPGDRRHGQRDKSEKRVAPTQS
jgi:hypothetical protein